jgi:hypothetical protein
LKQRRQADLLELVERLGVAEKEGLIRGHRLDHVADDRFVILGSDEADEVVEGGELPFARDREQAAFQQVGLVVGQQEAGPGLEDLANKVEVRESSSTAASYATLRVNRLLDERADLRERQDR